MCTGAEAVALAGLAASAAGTGVSISAASQARAQMEKTLRSQLSAQEGFQRQATPLFEQSLEASSPAAARQQQSLGEQAAQRLYSDVQNLPATATAPIASDRLVDTASRAKLGQQNRAQASLQGYSAFDLAQWLKNARAREQLGVVSNLSKGSAGLTPYLLQGAQNSQQDLATIGSLLGTAGSLAGVYGSIYPALQTPQTPLPPMSKYPVM